MDVAKRRRGKRERSRYGVRDRKRERQNVHTCMYARMSFCNEDERERETENNGG